MAMSQKSFSKVEVGPVGSGQFSPGLAVLCLQDDLVQTIGVSAALGAAGVVLWGDLSFSSSEVNIVPPTCHAAHARVPGLGKRPCQSHRAGALIHHSPLFRRSAGISMTT